MCANFLVRWNADLIEEGLFQESLIDEKIYADKLISPYTKAPVLRRKPDGTNRVQALEMQFSLVPRWSKEPKVKFATHNARIESITEKPTWKESFKSRHCIVPISEFIEPIYTGRWAGHMVAFSSSQRLWGAGIWDEWLNRQTGELITSFSIITNEPPPFIDEAGHDRCPVFLNQAQAQKWLQNENEKPDLLVEFLKQNICREIEFKDRMYRALKPGWEKRI